MVLSILKSVYTIVLFTAVDSNKEYCSVSFNPSWTQRRNSKRNHGLFPALKKVTLHCF